MQELFMPIRLIHSSTEMNQMLMILFRHGLHGFHGSSAVNAQSYRVIRVIRA